MKVYEALADAFVGEGVTAIFGMMGDGNMFWMSALEKRQKQARIYEVRFEGAGLAMADGWARASGEVGVCAVTSGPGVAQLATSLLVASRARTPIVVFAGDTSEGSSEASQALDQRKFAEATEAGYVRVHSAGSAQDAVRKAFNLARIESRPVLLSVPMDIQQQNVEIDGPYESSKTLPEAQRGSPDPAVLKKAAEIVRASRKPVVIAGRGALAAQAEDGVVHLAERIGAILATSLLAKTWLAEHEFHAGISGVFAPARTTELFEEADCVIGVGASLNSYTLESGYLFPNARFIQIDSAPQVVMGTGKPAECYVRGDARVTVEALEALLAEEGFSQEGYRTQATREALAAEIDPAKIEIEAGVVDPREACTLLDELLPAEIGLCTGVGHYFSFPAMHMRRPRSPALTALQFGCIGQGLGTAIGATIASGKPMVLIEGDASLMMHVQELDTASRYGVPLLVVVMNDQALGAEYQKMKAHDLDPEPSVIPTPDIAMIAEGMRFRGRKATTIAAFRAAVEEFTAKPGPMLIDLHVSRNVVSVPYRRLHFGQSA